MRPAPLARKQTAWMMGYIEGINGHCPEQPPEILADRLDFLNGHAEGKAARERVNAAKLLGDNGTGPR